MSTRESFFIGTSSKIQSGGDAARTTRKGYGTMVGESGRAFHFALSPESRARPPASARSAGPRRGGARVSHPPLEFPGGAL